MLLKNLFKLYALMLWDANTDSGSGSGNTSTGEGGSGGGDDNSGGQGQAGQQGDNTQTGGGQQSGSTAPTFTQEDLNRVAARERKDAMAKWAKEHGFEDAKDLEAIIKAKKEADEQAKTELQKAQEAATREKTAREAAEAALKTERIKAAVIAKATELNFAFPADTLALLDLSAFEIDDKGKVTGFDKPLEELAKSGRLPMKTQQQQQIGNQTRRVSGGNQQQDNQQGQQQQERPIIGF